jgi:hypothetical protein
VFKRKHAEKSKPEEAADREQPELIPAGEQNRYALQN